MWYIGLNSIDKSLYAFYSCELTKINVLKLFEPKTHDLMQERNECVINQKRKTTENQTKILRDC